MPSLELVRYIALNPVRAGLVGTMEALEAYPYTGHAVILGHRDYPCQQVDEVLLRFGRRVRNARGAYRAFVAAGFGEGVREELRGGGLVRSAGGWANLVNRGKEDRELGDERVLGGGAFVSEVLDQADVPIRQPGREVEAVLAEVCREHTLDQAVVLGRTRRRSVVRAHEEAGESFAALGRLCTMSHTSVRTAIERAGQRREDTLR